MGDGTFQVIFILVISLTYLFQGLHQVISGKLCISDFIFWKSKREMEYNQ